MRLTIAVDFDETITSKKFPEMGEPNSDVVNLLRQLRTSGWHIIIHTCRINGDWPEPSRSQKEAEMVSYLIEHEVPYDTMWKKEGKPLAHVYLEDRSLNPKLLHPRTWRALINLIAR